MALVYLGALLLAARPIFFRDTLELRVPLSGFLFLPFLIYGALWVPFAPVPYEAALDWLRAFSFFVAYWAWTELAVRYKRWRILLAVPLFVGTLVAWYALIQHAHESVMVLNMTRPAQYEMRASGTFMAPTHFAAYLGTLICLALALVTMPTAGPGLRLLAGYGLVLFLPALFLSESRSGWVGAVVGISVFSLLMMWRKNLRSVLLTLVVLPTLLAALVAGLWWGSPMFRQRTSEAIALQGSAASRIVMWKDTLEMIKDQPVFGHGPSSYRWVYPRYKSWGEHRWVSYAHNDFLQLIADYGLIGFILLAAALLTVLVRLLLRFRRLERSKDVCLTAGWIAAVCAALAHALFDFNLHVFSIVHLLVLFGGVTIASLHSSDVLRERVVKKGLWRVGAGGMALLLLVSLVLTVRIAASGALSRLAEGKRTSVTLQNPSGLQDARRLYEWATRVDSGYWIPYLELGNLSRREAFWFKHPEQKREKAEEALRYYTEAQRRHALDTDVLFGIGKTYYLLGDEESSLKYLRQAIASWPTHSYYARELGLQLRAMERYEEALDAFRYAATLQRDPVVQSNIRWLERRLSESK